MLMPLGSCNIEDMQKLVEVWENHRILRHKADEEFLRKRVKIKYIALSQQERK